MIFKRKTKMQSFFSFIALSDMAFLLLVFLILSSSLNQNLVQEPQDGNSSSIFLTSSTPFATLTLNLQGEVFYQNQPLLITDFTKHFLAPIKENPQLSFLIKAPKNLPYHFIERVIFALQKIGWHSFLFVSL